MPRLLLVPSFTELEWGIRDALAEWADVGSFDTPGVGGEPLPPGFDLSAEPTELLALWREAAAERGLAEADSRGWDQFVVVTDALGTATAVRLAGKRRDSVLGVAIGHAALSHSTQGPRAPMSGQIFAAMRQLATQGTDAFVRFGIAQATRGGIDEETAGQMVERFPDMALIKIMLDALHLDPEPIGDQLAALDLPLLLAKHEGCLIRTEEGFDDIAAALPSARTVTCPEACSSSPAFAEALRAFCA